MPKPRLLPALSISPEKHASSSPKLANSTPRTADPASGSNASDDGMRSVLEDRTDDPILTELMSFIDDLNDDEQIDLVALARTR